MTIQPDKKELLHSFLHSGSGDFLDLEIAHESGNSLIDSFTTQGKPFCLLPIQKVASSQEDQERMLTDIAFKVFSTGLGFILVRGFDSRQTGHQPLHALFLPCQLDIPEPEFFQIVKPLISHPHVTPCIYSNGSWWAIIDPSEETTSTGTEYTVFQPSDLKRAWSEAINRKISYAEALYCTGGVWSKASWRSVGLISAISGPYTNVLRALGNRFQKAPVGTVITVDGVEYRCIDHRIWSDGKREFMPKGELFHVMADRYNSKSTRGSN